MQYLNERILISKDENGNEINQLVPPIVADAFEKVSFEQFKKDMIDEYPYFVDDEQQREDHGDEEIDRRNEMLLSFYNDIKLPTRSTDLAAGYDFYAPFKFSMVPGTTVKIPTGIRVNIRPTWWLMLCPKSGHGFKYYVHLANTIGVDDADYYFSNNSGHIFIKIEFPHIQKNQFDPLIPTLFGKDIRTKLPMEYKVEKGEKFTQGIFLPYGVTQNDDEIVKEKRTGGMGSTGKF